MHVYKNRRRSIKVHVSTVIVLYRNIIRVYQRKQHPLVHVLSFTTGNVNNSKASVQRRERHHDGTAQKSVSYHIRSNSILEVEW